MATVDCVNCGRHADDMDGRCPHCGKSVYADVAGVFTGAPVNTPQPVSSAGRGVRRRIAQPPREDRSWTEDLTAAVSEAQELHERTLADWERANTVAKIAEERITMHHWAERVLNPAERHDFVERLKEITFANSCWDAHVRARDRYLRLLAEFGELERPGLGLPRQGGFADPGDPYAHGDDGSLAWVERQAEKARRDRRHDGPARGFTLD